MEWESQGALTVSPALVAPGTSELTSLVPLGATITVHWVSSGDFHGLLKPPPRNAAPLSRVSACWRRPWGAGRVRAPLSGSGMALRGCPQASPQSQASPSALATSLQAGRPPRHRSPQPHPARVQRLVTWPSSVASGCLVLGHGASAERGRGQQAGRFHGDRQLPTAQPTASGGGGGRLTPHFPSSSDVCRSWHFMNFGAKMPNMCNTD